MKSARILVVDDEEVVCKSCHRLLSEEGHRVDTSLDPRDGLAMAEQNPYDLIIVDLKMPGISGMEFLQRIRAVRPETEVVMMTGYAQIATAVEAMKLGAFDYIPKPFSPDQLVVTVGKALETRELLSENRYLRRELQSRYKFENIIGGGKEMQVVYDLIARVSGTNATVLIRGESGTGKELIARAIHFNSPRKTMRFVAVDCGALHDSLLESELFGHAKGAFTGAISAKKGLFEIADGGTLFLDEVGNTSLTLQAKLLRVLQQRVFTPLGDTEERKTDIRLIAATNKDLEAAVADGSFREELFYRLYIVPILVPPLRKRRDDIPALVRHFLKKFREETGCEVSEISPDALSLLVDYDWPGNVRQLENVIHRAVVLAPGQTILAEQLPSEIRSDCAQVSSGSVPKTSEELKERKKELREKSVAEVERLFVTEALKRNGWNVTRAAAEVGMQRPNFQAMMRQHHITPGKEAPDPDAP
ncbi:MAG: Fis family transcriptional regulator [Planctomycetes bacterium RBG_16_64_12]|nr:MAG: Fis family transcriptional regulator [Planctomycetes bacterium RBG_16_64_12]